MPTSAQIEHKNVPRNTKSNFFFTNEFVLLYITILTNWGKKRSHSKINSLYFDDFA